MMIAIESTSLTQENRRPDPPFLVRPKDREMLEPPGQRGRVLVVDDHKLIADSLSEILTNAGFDAVAAYDGREALDVMGSFHPDWILSDVLMPRMNGVELAIEVRIHYPTTEILLFSGQAGVSEILQNAQGRGYEFELVAKPIHPSKLIERLSRRSPL